MQSSGCPGTPSPHLQTAGIPLRKAANHLTLGTSQDRTACLPCSAEDIRGGEGLQLRTEAVLQLGH